MGGNLGETVGKLVDKFNASHKDIQVQAVFQGTYDEELTKLRQSLQSKTVPHLVQVYDIGQRFMVDTKEIKPVQDFIDAEKYDISDFEPNVVKYYTLNDKLNAMPFNTSTAILYYYKDMFKEAGLDPEKPPATFQEFAVYARKLTKKDASGQVSQYGAVLAIYGWLVEQFLANQNALYVDNGNGRDKPATAAVFNSPAGEAAFGLWKQGLQDGWLLNTGRVTGDAQNAFIAGKAAMNIESTAVLRRYLDGSQGKHELATAFLPRDAKADKGGVIIGGASLWVMKDHPDPELKATWEFIKFLAAPEQQAFWHINTGYYPIRKSTYDQADDKAWVEKYPQFKTAITQLRASPDARPEQGAVIGVFPQSRQAVEGALEAAALNKSPVKEALDKAAKEITAAIQQYNKTVGL